MKIISAPSENLITEFLKNVSQQNLRGAEFLVSQEWGELLQTEGAAIQNLAVLDDGKIITLFNEIRKKIPGGFFYYYPRGPLIDPSLVAVQKSALEKILKKRAKDQGAIFLRLEPNYLWASLRETVALQPAQTLILDLNLKEEELLAAMHQKTRYNIRLATKRGVRVRQGAKDDFADFWRLMQQTGERDNFGTHPQKHYEALLENPEFIKLFVAEVGGEVIAAGLFAFYLDKVTYLHGASDYKHRALMAPYLLQWEVIKKAQKEGYRFYDFYGIDEKKWPGVTRFKLGFGGRLADYPGTFDLVLCPLKYKVYNFLRRLNRYLRSGARKIYKS